MKLILLLSALLICAAVDGRAEGGHFYGQFSAGIGLPADAENIGDDGQFNLEYETGSLLSLSVGYALSDSSVYNGGRVELEAAWRENGVDSVEFAEGDFPGGGDLKVWSLLLSSYAEHRSQSPWTPYFGLGLGVASVSLDALTVSGAPLADDEDILFAYQIATGVDFSLSQAWRIDLGYRFFGTSDPSFKDDKGESFDSEYQNHSFLAGLRFLF